MKVVFLAKKSMSTNIMFNEISRNFKIEAIIFETPVLKRKLIERRIKKLGLWKVLGQILFQTIIVRILRVLSKNRISEIIREHEMNDQEVCCEKEYLVKSVNNYECIAILKEISPDVIVVNGTRIISKRVLDATNATFINLHVGITPKYRGVHGAYWALVNNDRENAGTTIHLIDQGIDTGNVIYQEKIEISQKDNFVTYPYLQLAKGRILMVNTLNDLKRGALKTKQKVSESILWYHPTIGQYIYYLLFKGIK
jgi:methionyl-tRNA formyltransferase